MGDKEATVIWPERPTCHDDDWQANKFSEHLVWREPESKKHGTIPYRKCGYCGSIHPEDLLAALEAGAVLHGADWKYGWPHKFYVDGIPNPEAGRMVVKSSKHWTDEEGNRRHEEYPEPEADTVGGKWYNEHLLDLSREAFALVAGRLSEVSHISFSRTDEGRLRYTAPYRGYQKTSLG